MGKYDMIENRSPGEKAGNIISDEGNCFMEEMRKKGNVIALLPIGVFLVLYLGLGILFAYDFFLYADALLFKRLDPTIWEARGLASVLAAPLIAVAAARNPE